MVGFSRGQGVPLPRAYIR